jgi:predicted secreted protein with PEFG-CTERM motif
MRLADIPVRVWTDKQVYDYGSSVHIQGVVANLKADLPVTVKVTGPQGNVVRIDQVDVTNDKTYDVTINAVGGLWKQSGVYTIRVQYGSEETNDKTTFELVGTPGSVSACNNDEIGVTSATNVYCLPISVDGIKVTKATVSSETTSIVLMVDAANDGAITLTIPRNVLDSQSNDGDSPFVVLVDEEEADATEVASDSTSRTLEITVPVGASTVEIVGTFAVPEFGTMAAIILAVAIVSIIAVSARSRLGVLSRY